MKTLFLAITLNIVALSSPFWSLYSQEVRQPRGIVIYDPSKLGDKFGQAKIYSQMTPHGISTDIVTTDGERIKIVGGQLLSLVQFPTNSSPEEWRTVADKLGELASKYPLASKRLLDEESAARNKVEMFTKIAAEEALRKQRIQAEETLRKQRIEALKAHQAKQIGRTITFSDNAGKAYTNVRLEAISPVGITISDSGEQKRVPFTEVSKEIQAFLGYDPKVAAEYIQEIREKEDHERRIAAAKLAQEEQQESERRKREEMANLFEINLVQDTLSKETYPKDDASIDYYQLEGEPIFIAINRTTEQVVAVQFTKDLTIIRENQDPVQLHPDGEWKTPDGEIVPGSTEEAIATMRRGSPKLKGFILFMIKGKGYVSPNKFTYQHENGRTTLDRIIISTVMPPY